ncbi:MAG: YicC/YloC family endoribonuclease [Oligoflexus sp.]
MPINSMTAFGVGETTRDDYHYRCEVKTLNARFLDVNVRLPRTLNALERDITQFVKKALKRGKVDISFDLSVANTSHRLGQLNEAAVLHYQALAEKVASLLGNQPKPLTIYEILRLDGVLDSHTKETTDDMLKHHRDGFLQSLDAALRQIADARKVEGQALEQALREILKGISQDRQAIAVQSEEVQKQIYQQYRKRLENLIKNLGETGQTVSKQLPEERLLTEVAILTDKSDIDEELTRLATHEQEFIKTLQAESEVGRKLDFLCQEMHREVNTMSNKSTHTTIAKHTLAIKQAVERLRQQVQNIE